MHLVRWVSRYGIAVLVCALALSVLSFGAAAKRSQYPPEHAFCKHLSQAAKMSNDGAQTSADFACPAVPVVFAPPEVQAEPLPITRERTRPRAAVFLAAFRFRPPPSF